MPCSGMKRAHEKYTGRLKESTEKQKMITGEGSGKKLSRCRMFMVLVLAEPW